MLNNLKKKDLEFEHCTASLEKKESRKQCVVKELSKLDHVILVTSRSDKFDRYLADIYYGKDDEKFLNQILLDTGHAVKMTF